MCILVNIPTMSDVNTHNASNMCHFISKFGYRLVMNNKFLINIKMKSIPALYVTVVIETSQT